MHRKSWHKSSSATILMFLAIAIVMLSLNASVTKVSAQDYIDQALDLVREAIEEEKEVSLATIVKWEFFQDDWSTPYSGRADSAAGIDACDLDVSIVNASRTYFGWTFRITDRRNDVYEGRVSFDLREVVVCDQVGVGSAAAPAASTGGDQSVDAGAPVVAAGAAASGGFEIGGHVDGLTPDAMSKMRSARMTWVKKQLPMSAGVGKGQEFINDAHANGFRILLGVVGDKNALAADFEGYVASFSQFAASLASAGADAIEVWNEPNIDREWPAGQINGASYTRMLAAAYQAIKAANPNTMVISGAPAPTGYFGAAGCADGGCNDDVFMQQMAAAGAAQYMDCVGLHYNEGIVSPSSNTNGGIRNDYPSNFFTPMLNRGYTPFGGTKVCFTELGYLSAEGMGSAIPSSFGWAANVTVAQQAAWLAEAAAASAQSGKVRLMIVWNVNFTRWDSDPMGGYAIVRPDGSCPACGTLGTAMGG